MPIPRPTIRTAGQILLPSTASPGLEGPVHIFYRPEDVLLGTPMTASPGGASLTAPVSQILPTRPLARISLASDPPVTALVLHRDLERLRMRPGEPIQATLPLSSIRVFPATPAAPGAVYGT
jgi:hypothetical protein